MSLVGFQASKIYTVFFGKFRVKQVLKLFYGRNNSRKLPVFEFCDSLPYGLEESELRTFISWVLDLQAFENAKNI